MRAKSRTEADIRRSLARNCSASSSPRAPSLRGSFAAGRLRAAVAADHIGQRRNVMDWSFSESFQPKSLSRAFGSATLPS